MESKDNKLEDIFFASIVKNPQFNGEILKIYDLVDSQNISGEDKKTINEKIFGYGLTEEDEEIEKLLKIIRDDNIKNHLLYKLIFELVEDVLDVDDKKHLSILLSNVKEEVQTDVIYFLRDVLEYISKELGKKFSKRKTITETLSKDYLDNNELDSLLAEIDDLFKKIILEIKNSDEKKAIEEKINKEVEKKKRISEIR